MTWRHLGVGHPRLVLLVTVLLLFTTKGYDRLVEPGGEIHWFRSSVFGRADDLSFWVFLGCVWSIWRVERIRRYFPLAVPSSSAFRLWGVTVILYLAGAWFLSGTFFRRPLSYTEIGQYIEGAVHLWLLLLLAAYSATGAQLAQNLRGVMPCGVVLLKCRDQGAAFTVLANAAFAPLLTAILLSPTLGLIAFARGEASSSTSALQLFLNDAVAALGILVLVGVPLGYLLAHVRTNTRPLVWRSNLQFGFPVSVALCCAPPFFVLFIAEENR